MCCYFNLLLVLYACDFGIWARDINFAKIDWFLCVQQLLSLSGYTRILTNFVMLSTRQMSLNTRGSFFSRTHKKNSKKAFIDRRPAWHMTWNIFLSFHERKEVHRFWYNQVLFAFVLSLFRFKWEVFQIALSFRFFLLPELP